MQTFSPLAQWHLFSNAKALHDENDVQRSHQARSVVLLLPLCHFRFPLRRQLCWKCVWTARKMNCNDCLMMTPGIPASGNYKMHRLCVLRSCVCVIVACVEEPRRDRERWKPDFQRIALQCCLVLLCVSQTQERLIFNEILRTAVCWSLTAFPLGQTAERERGMELLHQAWIKMERTRRHTT